MLTITIPATEAFDESTGQFLYTKEQTLQLEHSLVSISKWESKWAKPFLDKRPKTTEETVDYVKCMTLNKSVEDEIYNCLTSEHYKKINDYIGAPMTATYFYTNERGKKGADETITSELIYYWMIALNIPFECQKWHLNRLLTLVRVCNIKNSPPKKMSKRDIMSRNAQLNAARRKQFNTKG